MEKNPRTTDDTQICFKESDYEKPLFEKNNALIFPEKIWETLNNGKFVQTCSKCHHCR